MKKIMIVLIMLLVCAAAVSADPYEENFTGKPIPE